MKTTTIAILSIAMVFISCSKQHRLDYLKSSGISSMEVVMIFSDWENKTLQITDKSDINRIIDFLLRTEFTPYSTGADLKKPPPDQWHFKLIFEGQQDQIFLYTDHALIGKSIYHIENNVVKEFKKLIRM